MFITPVLVYHLCDKLGTSPCPPCLVTTFKTYKTDNDNFNFLFSQDDDRLAQWDTIYLLIPYVLFYATEIIEELITSLVKIPKEILEINKIRRQIRFLIWTQSCGNDVNEFLNSIKDELKFTCPHCRSSITMKKRNLNRFAFKNYIVCPKCKFPLSFNRELSLNKHKPKVYSLVCRLHVK